MWTFMQIDFISFHGSKKISDFGAPLRLLSTGIYRSVADPGCLSRILDPNFFIPDPGFWIWIRIEEFKYFQP